MTQSMRQVLEWDLVGRRRASEMTSSPRDGDTLSALGQHHQPRWSVGRSQHTSLFGAGCFLLGEALRRTSLSLSLSRISLVSLSSEWWNARQQRQQHKITDPL